MLSKRRMNNVSILIQLNDVEQSQMPTRTHTRPLEQHLLEETGEYRGSGRFGSPLLLIPFEVSTQEGDPDPCMTVTVWYLLLISLLAHYQGGRLSLHKGRGLKSHRTAGLMRVEIQ